MGLLKRFSLMTKLVAISLVTTTILGFGAWLSMNQISVAFNERLIANFEFLADNLGESIAYQFAERYSDTQVLASSESVKLLNAKAIKPELDAFAQKFSFYDLIMIVDKNGKYIASNSKDVSGKPVNVEELSKQNFSSTAWFKACAEGKTSDDPDKNLVGTYFEDMQIDPVLKTAFGEDKVSNGFSAPIKNAKGQFIGVITNRVNDSWVANVINMQLSSLIEKSYRQAQIVLLNNSGEVLYEAAYDAPNGSRDHQLKLNLVKEQYRAAISAVGGNAGAEFMFDKRRGFDNIAGFQNIDSVKWLNDIGWSIIVSDSKTNALIKVTNAMHNFYLVLGMTSFIAIAFSILFSIILSKAFQNITNTLGLNAKEVGDASYKIASHATQLSQAATEQASALQETIAAVDEINAMVEKNAESANRSIEVSGKSREAAEYGRKIVEDMISAINDIDNANQEITDQMDQSNKQLSDITKLVNDIGTKTKVINEIVFQTKLLSFNASVEAARAGEYGKGFSVVAEEVGNLAQMSGNAAKEITALLEESIEKVESIVNDSKSRVQKLTVLAKDRVNSGANTAKECNEALEEILKNVQSVDALVSEIATASKEQSSGIHEISRAVSEMESMTEQNSSVAQGSSVAAEQLKVQSTSLGRIVDELVAHVKGGRRAKLNAPNNVVSLRSKGKKESKVKQEQIVPSAKIPKAVGDDNVPKFNDPGFEE